MAKSLGPAMDTIGFLCMCTGVGEVITEGIGFIGGVALPAWFRKKGLKGHGNILATNVVIELFPFLNGFYPGFTIAIWRLIAIMNEEDEKAGEKKLQEEQAIAMQQQQQARGAQIREEQLRMQQVANDNEEEARREAA